MGKHKISIILYLNMACTVSGHKLDHLALNSTTAVTCKAGCTLASAATAVLEFMAKWLNLYLLTVGAVLNASESLPL